MKNITALFSLLFIFALSGCEETVDLDLDTQAPRLVIDASIDWVKDTDGSQQTIRLTTTAAYYTPSVPAVTGASVTVANSSGDIFTFAEDIGTGNYICNDFVPVIGEIYSLTVVHEGQTYTAQETMIAAPDILAIEQDDEGGFLGDEVEVKFFYQDEAMPGNHYLVRFETDDLPFPDIEAISDEFINGNQTFEIFSTEDLGPGDDVAIRIYGISERYYDYMLKLLLMTGGSGGPFATAPATVRGNLVNQTDESNFALGFFRLSEVDRADYQVQ